MDEQYGTWLGEKRGQACVANLEKHGFDAGLFPDAAAARDHILAQVADCESFGFGGSDTTRQMGLVQALQAAGKTVYDHWLADLSRAEDRQLRLDQGRCDCFLCSANAVSMTGEIVNVDGIGNRTSAMCFGPTKVVIVAGINKITPDLPSALNRVREVAGPMRAKSLNMQTPCAETGVCTDCNAPQRICRITTILHRRPSQTAVAVVLVNQRLGF